MDEAIGRTVGLIRELLSQQNFESQRLTQANEFGLQSDNADQLWHFFNPEVLLWWRLSQRRVACIELDVALDFMCVTVTDVSCGV